MHTPIIPSASFVATNTGLAGSKAGSSNASQKAWGGIVTTMKVGDNTEVRCEQCERLQEGGCFDDCDGGPWVLKKRCKHSAGQQKYAPLIVENKPKKEEYERQLRDAGLKTTGSMAVLKERLKEHQGRALQWERINNARKTTIDLYELGVLITGVKDVVGEYDLPFRPDARRYDAKADEPAV